MNCITLPWARCPWEAGHVSCLGYQTYEPLYITVHFPAIPNLVSENLIDGNRLQMGGWKNARCWGFSRFLSSAFTDRVTSHISSTKAIDESLITLPIVYRGSGWTWSNMHPVLIGYRAHPLCVHFISSIHTIVFLCSYHVSRKFAENDDSNGKHVLCVGWTIQPWLHHHLRPRNHGRIRL